MPANGSPASPQELWRHSAPESTRIYHFMKTIAAKHGIPLRSYNDLWNWSISEPAKFWEEIWLYTSIIAHRPYDHVRILSAASYELSTF